jgi:hypothetical protein
VYIQFTEDILSVVNIHNKSREQGSPTRGED